MWCKCAFKTDGKIRTAFAFRTIDGISGNLSYGAGVCDFTEGDQISDYTHNVLHLLLSSKGVHAVRDEKTRYFLEQIGIHNVIRTGCPSLWSLTAQRCKKIPKKKEKKC